RALIRALPDTATRPEMTALWEATLRRIQDGTAPLGGLLDAVIRPLRLLVERGKSAGALVLPGTEGRPCPSPGCGGTLRQRDGKRGLLWGCSRYPACTDAAAVALITPSRRSR